MKKTDAEEQETYQPPKDVRCLPTKAAKLHVRHLPQGTAQADCKACLRPPVSPQLLEERGGTKRVAAQPKRLFAPGQHEASPMPHVQHLLWLVGGGGGADRRQED
jgi:hypothetical protein